MNQPYDKTALIPTTYVAFEQVKDGVLGVSRGLPKGIGALRKYAGGIFLATDRSGYAARNSVLQRREAKEHITQ